VGVVTRRHKPPLRRPKSWGRGIQARTAAVPPAPDPDWDAWDGIPELVKSTAETFGLGVDDLHCHLEGQHGWEPHDVGYEVAVAEAAACASRSVRAGGSAQECLRLDRDMTQVT
jgi:hypothetical protein